MGSEKGWGPRAVGLFWPGAEKGAAERFLHS